MGDALRQFKSEIFQGLANPTRIANVGLLRGGELSPGKLIEELGNPSPVLAVALTAEQSSPQSLRRLEHEYSLAAELDPAWAARPLALTHYEGQTVLIVQDPGGEPLDQLLERKNGQTLDV